jgi:hypothetical protein
MDRGQARVDDIGIDIDLGELVQILVAQHEGEGCQPLLAGAPEKVDFHADATALLLQHLPDRAVDEARGRPVGNSFHAHALQADQLLVDIDRRIACHHPRDDG